MPKVSDKVKADAQARKFDTLIKQLRSRLEKRDLPKGVTERDQRLLGHDCPDKQSARKQLFNLLDDAGVHRDQYDPRFIVGLHAVYLNELYYAGELELSFEVKVVA